MPRKFISLFLLLLAACGLLRSQRTYAPNSVLASGTWFKLSVTQPGVYRIDLSWLTAAGLSSSGIQSASIRLFGNGGQMLPEPNNSPRPDDLQELSLQVVDGGDGAFNGSDYLLFYAPGPDRWITDSANRRFSHQKNLYSDKAYYFLSLGSGTGLRIANAPNPGPALNLITSFAERSYHELDTVNFLSSGKEWYGEEMSDLPGRSLSRSFSLALTERVPGTPVQLKTRCAARSAGSPGSLTLRFNGAEIGQLAIPPVGTSAFDAFAKTGIGDFQFTPPGGSADLSYTFRPGSVNAQSWIDWFELSYRRNLSMAGLAQLSFREWPDAGNSISEFQISNATAATQVWNVSNPVRPLAMTGTFSGGQYRFAAGTGQPEEYIAFREDNFRIPAAEGVVANQNLHAASPRDFIVITHPPFLPAANRLAEFHRRQDGMRCLVVTTTQVYNEFSAGSPDPVALRDFFKMYHDKFSADSVNRLKYVLLLGDASFDYRDRLAGNTAFVPAWESEISIDPLATYTSDDFFGLLDDQDDISSGLSVPLLDIGIGRVPAKTLAEANSFADKVEAYFSPGSLGSWRNEITLIADDEDQNLHLQDAESIATTAASAAPGLTINKIYLDAYRQQTGPGGSTYPGANEAINNQALAGTLIWNFTGHGSSKRLAEEVVLDREIVDSWKNEARLPVFITATCDFAPYDIPGSESLGENILLRPGTGAIALMTTTRIVFAYSNRVMNNNYMQFALQPRSDGRYRRLGDAVRDAKNFTYQTASDIANIRKFTLLGDPAMMPGFAEWKVRVTRVNGMDAAQTDTIRAGDPVQVEGEITDGQGNLVPAFQGAVSHKIFDKPVSVTTLGNDPASPPAPFMTQSSPLFSGKSTVTNGRFSFRFKLPRDINYTYGNGRMSFYGQQNSQAAAGYYSGFVVGGSANGTDTDHEGPLIKAYLNDEKFVNGGLTNTHPMLILRLSDSSGINTTGTGIGHDLMAVLDQDNRRFFVLNRFYETETDNYQAGTVRFQLPELDPGPHTLTIKAWDGVNNSGQAELAFVVASDEGLELSHVLNYPNPFSTRTAFWFEHNKPGLDLNVRIQIFTISGRVIKSIQKTINTPGNRSNDLEWDGRDDFGDRVAKGVYLYKLSVIAPGTKKMEKIGKLVVF